MARIAPALPPSLPRALENPHVFAPAAAAPVAECAVTGRHVAWGDVSWSSAEDLEDAAHACHGGRRLLGGSDHKLAAHAIDSRGPAATSSFSAGNSASSLVAETSGCSAASESYLRMHAPAEQLDAMPDICDSRDMHPMAPARGVSAPAIVAAARALFLQDSEQGDDSCVSTVLHWCGFLALVVAIANMPLPCRSLQALAFVAVSTRRTLHPSLP